MDTEIAEKLALTLFDEFGLISRWRFRWDNSKRRFGCCNTGRKTISLSKPLTLLNTVEEVEDVIRSYVPNSVSGQPRIDSRGVVHVELQSPKGYVVASMRYYRHDSIIVVRRAEA